ncbi:MAG: 16S rRNA processing protein RimM [Firmicutes bacterium]|nr:16S rRNA processing protein RimM [Bacillota bacterium]
MEKILIGKITSAVGLKGEVKVYNYSDSTEIYENTPQIYVGDERMAVQSVRTQKNMVVLKLEGIGDRDAAEKARGRELFVTEEDLPELPEGQFYVRDLIGMEVFSDEGQRLGPVTDVIQNTAQDIFEIEMEDGRKVLIPKVDSYVLEIDGENRRITVHLQEGILDL